MAMVIIILAGCAPKATMRHLWPGKPVAAKSPGEVLLFGKLAISVDGNPIAFKKAKFPQVSLSFFHSESGLWTDPVYIEEDGSFYWVLERGTYVFGRMQGFFNKSLFGPEGAMVDPHMAIELKDPGARAFYAGAININVESSEVVSVTVDEESLKARAALLERNPDISLVNATSAAMAYYDPSITAPPLDAPRKTEDDKTVKTLKLIGSISLKVVAGTASAFSGIH